MVENGTSIGLKTLTLSTMERIVNTYSAFTVAELGAMLPNEYHSGRTITGEEYWVWMRGDESKLLYADTEADARAKCLIYLLDNNLLTKGA